MEEMDERQFKENKNHFGKMEIEEDAKIVEKKAPMPF